MNHELTDTRVTAYVFGELSSEETATLESELANSSELQEELAAVREALSAVESEFAARRIGVGDSQREAIEAAIYSRPTTDKVNLNHTANKTTGRRWAVIAVLAASLLIVVGLAYPYLQSKTGTPISMSNPGSISNPAPTRKIVSEIKSGRETDKQVTELKRDDPIADSMTRTAQIGQRTQKAKTELSEQELAFDDEAGELVEGTTVQLPNFSYYVKPGEAAAGASPNRSQPLGRTSEGLSGALRTAVERSDAGDSSGKGLPADFDGADVLGGSTIDSTRKRQPRRSRGGMGDMEEMMEDMMGMDMDMGMGMAQGDKFEPIADNPFLNVHDAPLSTFSIDVDTASYSKVRALLNQNSLPRADAVRIEEFLNYFSYNYAPPEDDHPFAASMEIAACPWNPKHRLARIGIKAKVIDADRPSSNLVFLLDVSGSMDEPNKLPLVIQGMRMLTDQLTENDKVSIVVYAGAAGMVLDATRGDKKRQIVAALDRLKAGGSTNGGQGIMLAYQLARDNFIVGGTNRVILCSDGDFNVGVTGTDQLVSIAQENAKSNIFLSVLGFGIGNHNDAMMEQISNQANGNYAFIDSKSEAKKVLVEELGGTLVTIAKDVKIQIEFNPQEVASYRLIGYENRMLEAQDFNDDKKDAGEIGAGHTVTALYEIVPAKVDDVGVSAVDNLRYQKQIKLSKQAHSGEMLTLKLRYKQPEGNTSTLIEFPVSDAGKKFSQTDRDFQFAAAVASFGMLLRNSPHKGNATFAGVARIAREGAKGDESGYRIEFLELVTKAKQLSGE